jgi:PAS domain S-box-containing protein
MTVSDQPPAGRQLASEDGEVPWPTPPRAHDDARAAHHAAPVAGEAAPAFVRDQGHASPVADLPDDVGHASDEGPELDITSLDLGGDVVFITDRSGTIVDVNDAFVRVTGYSREEAIGASPRLLSSGLQDERFYAELWRTILDGNVWEGQLVDRRRDGSLRTHRVTITPVRDRAGRVTHFVAVERDVTAELGRQVAHGSTGLLHTDVTGRCVYADGQAAALLDRRPTELLGDGLLRAVVDEDAEAWREIITLAVERGREHRLEIRTHAGGWLHLEVAPLAVASGNVIGATCAVEDVAAKVEAERELERREALMDSVLDALDDAVAVVASDGTVVTVNAAWREAAERTPEHALVTAEAGDDLLARVRQLAAQGDDDARRAAHELHDVLTGLGVPRSRGRIRVSPLAWDEGGAVIRLDDA